MNRLKKKIIYVALTLIIGAITSAYMNYTNQIETSNDIKTEELSKDAQVKGIDSQTATVVKVIDGDTFEIENKQKVRLVGIDTPELHHPKKEVQCYGKEAMEKTKELLEGKTVRLERDVSQTDRYGRLLRFVYLVDLSPTPSTATQPAEIFINAYLVKEGFAHTATFPPDVSNSKYFSQLEKEAIYNNKGLWSACN